MVLEFCQTNIKTEEEDEVNMRIACISFASQHEMLREDTNIPTLFIDILHRDFTIPSMPIFY